MEKQLPRRRKSYQVPSCFARNSGFWGSFQDALCCGTLTEDEPFSQELLSTFYVLSEYASETFDAANRQHVERFGKLFSLVFPGRKAPENPSVSEFWPEFGFQTPRAFTDLRFGGILSLEAMIRISEKNPEKISSIMAYMKEKGNFLFACSVISATFFLKSFFHFGLIQSGKSLRSLKKLSSNAAAVYFLSLIDPYLPDEKKKEGFLSLVEVYSLQLFDYWKELDDEEGLNIAYFTQVEERFEKMFSHLVERWARKIKQPHSLEDFLVAVKQHHFSTS